jgi:hypothetical protein
MKEETVKNSERFLKKAAEPEKPPAIHLRK